MEHCSIRKSIRVLQQSSSVATPRPVALLLLLLLSLSHQTFADDTIDAIRSELKSESVRDVDECIHQLTPQQVQLLTPELCDLADGSQALTCWSALRRLSQLKPTRPDLQQRVISVFIKQLGHEEHAHRQVAIEGLIKVGEPSVQPLLKELNQRRTVSKSAAAFALAELKSLPLGIALELSRDSDPRVRYAAIQALDGSVESMAELQRLIADPELAVAIAAADFVSLKIADPSPELIQALVAALEREELKLSSAYALARLGSLAQQAISAIIRANPEVSSFRLGSRSPWGHEEPLSVVSAFIGEPSVESLDELIDLLESDNLSIVESAARSISQLGTEARRAAPAIARKLVELNANPPVENEMTGNLVDPRPELINAIWTVTRDFDQLVKYLDSESWVSWSDRYEDYNTLFLRLTKLSNGKLVDRYARQLIHRLRRDGDVMKELESRLRNSESPNRRCLAEAFLKLLRNPNEEQKELIVTLHNQGLLSAEEIAQRVVREKSFLIPAMEDPIGKLLLNPKHRYKVFLSEAWIALANDREAALTTLLANPNVDSSSKAKAIGNLRIYNPQSMAFLKKQLYSRERWQQINAIVAVGIAGDAAKPLAPDLRKILDSKKRKWVEEKRQLDWDTKYHDFEFESAVGLALYRIEKNEKLLVQLVEGCRTGNKFVPHMLVKLLTAAGGNFKSVEAQVFEGLEQAVAEAIEGLKFGNTNIAALGRLAMMVNPKVARAKLEELRVHRAYFIREIAEELLKRADMTSEEVE